MSPRTRAGASAARPVTSAKEQEAQERKSFCGECLREIGGHWLRTVHLEDQTPICHARPVFAGTGPVITFDADIETRDRIAASGLDPRKHEYWEVHPASNGNKGWRSWKGEDKG